MPWVRLDDRFPSHRKVALLSDRAFRLHVSAICWCAENLTDGHISDRELPLVARLRNVKTTAKQLEDAGLWDRGDDGWFVHDYLDYNPSREQVLADRKKNAERQERFRRRKKGAPTTPDGDRNDRSNGVTQTAGSSESESNNGKEPHEDDVNAYGNHLSPDGDQQVNQVRNAVTNGAPTRPVPEPLSMADVDGGGTGSRGAAYAAPAAPPIEVDDFQLTDAMRRWAAATFPGIDVDHSTAQFVSHYRSTGDRRRSWPDAWQKWIRDDAQRASQRQQRSTANVIALPNGQTLTGTDARVAGWLAIADASPDEDSA